MVPAKLAGTGIGSRFKHCFLPSVKADMSSPQSIGNNFSTATNTGSEDHSMQQYEREVRHRSRQDTVTCRSAGTNKTWRGPQKEYRQWCQSKNFSEEVTEAKLADYLHYVSKCPRRAGSEVQSNGLAYGSVKMLCPHISYDICNLVVICKLPVAVTI